MEPRIELDQHEKASIANQIRLDVEEQFTGHTVPVRKAARYMGIDFRTFQKNFPMPVVKIGQEHHVHRAALIKAVIRQRGVEQ